MTDHIMHYYNYASSGLLDASVEKSIKDELSNYMPSTQEYLNRALYLRAEIKRNLADFINVDPESIGICQSTCQGIAEILHSLNLRRGANIGIFNDEYVNVDILLRYFSKRYGYNLIELERDPKFWPTDIRYDLLLLSHVSHLSGYISDISKIRLDNPNSIIILDCAQSVGNIHVDFNDRDNLFIVFPSYKWLLGPAGIAFIVVPSNFSKFDCKPKGLSHFAIDLAQYSTCKKIVTVNCGTIYENSSYCALAHAGFLHSIKMIRSHFESKANRSLKYAAHIAEIVGNKRRYKLISKLPIESGIVSVGIPNKDWDRIIGRLVAKKIVCSNFPNYDIIRFCFSGYESYEQIDELGDCLNDIFE